MPYKFRRRGNRSKKRSHATNSLIKNPEVVISENSVQESRIAKDLCNSQEYFKKPLTPAIKGKQPLNDWKEFSDFFEHLLKKAKAEINKNNRRREFEKKLN